MPPLTIPTDDVLRSKLEYGNADFPFSCYLDRVTQYQSQCIARHWHNEFEFSFVKTGVVNCHIGACSITLRAGDGMFINSGSMHCFDADEDSVLINCIFSPEFIAEKTSRIYDAYIQPFLVSDLEYKCFLRNDPQAAAVLERLKQAHAVIYSDCFGKELQIRIVVSSLWGCFAEGTMGDLRSAFGSHSKTINVRLHEMLTYIHANYHKALKLGDIALAANISKSEALRCFHVGLETTPVKYWNEYRLNRAAEELLATSDPVAVIAERNGFESAGYFCKAFKAKYRATPTAFRKLKKNTVKY